MANLVTLTEYKDYNKISGSTEDARLEVLVTSISQLVKTYCANSFVDYYDTPKVEFFNVDGYTEVIQLTESPIVAISSIETRATSSDSYSVLASSNYYLDSHTDSVFRLGQKWPTGPGAVKVTYTAGYETVPEDLRLAVYDLITYYHKGEYKERRTLGSSSITNQFSSTQWRNVDFPDHIKRVLDLYKLI